MESDSFTISIPKETLATLPVVEFSGHISVIDTMDEAVSALQFLSTQSIVGFDTETKPNFRKGQSNTVSLIQISTDSHSFLFRINKLGLFDQMRSFLESESTLKIGLSLKDDFHMLHRKGDFNPAGFIDLQSFVKEYHIADASLQKIYGIIFDRKISKSKRLSNWEAPTLTESQQTYASIDAWACLKIYNYLISGQFHPESSPYIVHEIPEDTTSTP